MGRSKMLFITFTNHNLPVLSTQAASKQIDFEGPPAPQCRKISKSKCRQLTSDFPRRDLAELRMPVKTAFEAQPPRRALLRDVLLRTRASGRRGAASSS